MVRALFLIFLGYLFPLISEPIELHIARKGAHIAVNDTIPGPTLYFCKGDVVEITVHNHLDEITSIHWHGLILPGAMDGVPGFNGFEGIFPGSSFTYRFPLVQSGTYWYHAHSMGQEQDGVYGAFIIDKTQNEAVIVLSDMSKESSKTIFNHLKTDADFYNKKRLTLFDTVDPMWGEMRMSPTDLADVSDYTFCINGKSPEDNWTTLTEPQKTLRLRFINASAMSMYDVAIPGLPMTLVAADGIDVEPIEVDEFRIGTAETYDVCVTPPDNMAYSIIAEPIDRSGFAIGTLAPQLGMKSSLHESGIPLRKRSQLTMADMMSGMDEKSGWADADTPCDKRALRYSDLRSLEERKQSPEPSRECEMVLGGNMERYIWTINGKKHAETLFLKKDERVRLTFINETMMAHPMHLHGMFVELENGQPPEKLPSKHTIIVPPSQSLSVLLTASEVGQWPLHCHLLYHMQSGMMSKVIVGEHEEPHAHEKMPLFHKITVHSGYASHSSFLWDVDAMIGNDDHRAVLRAENDELWGLYSQAYSDFLDFECGLFIDDETDNPLHIATGLTGLAPHFFEMQTHLCLSTKGDLSAHFSCEKDYLLTQKFIVTPFFKTRLFVQEQEYFDTGFSVFEGGLTGRYEVKRTFFPYCELSTAYKTKTSHTETRAQIGLGITL